MSVNVFDGVKTRVSCIKMYSLLGHATYTNEQ